MATYRTPGVYIQELDAFGNSVMPIPTAIPVFVGYTEKTFYNGSDLANKPVRITSLVEYEEIFGKNSQSVYSVSLTSDGSESDVSFNGMGVVLKQKTTNYRLYGGMRFFFENGGGDCYILSVGTYDGSLPYLTNSEPFNDALLLLRKEMEPSLLLIPDVVEFNTRTGPLKDRLAEAYKIQSAMIEHCGSLGSRFAILDIPEGYQEADQTSVIDQFRNSVEPILPAYNGYAAVYYPWLRTTVYQTSDVDYKNLDPACYAVVADLIRTEIEHDSTNKAALEKALVPFTTASPKPNELEQADKVLVTLSKSYKLLMTSILERLNLMGPASAMAGIYTKIDTTEGVWKAPANVSVQSVIEPVIKIDDTAQQNLNAPVDGKAVCAIRNFPGRGVMVWGARTLDGNSQDYRYVNVRRTLIFLEQSIKEATRAYVFAPNDSSTWNSVQSTLSNFLTGIWKQGGLAGDKASDAFFVSVGLGATMTGADVSAGIMPVSVKVAISHPAEFIVITFEQEMQKV
ncbi:MAG: phage tail sheath family protein [Bacteroidia bacterium]|nr:phage tail sheath family protein [Bacteroidia bacterium]